MALGDEESEADLHLTLGKFASSCLRPSDVFQSEWPDAREVATVRVAVSTLDRQLAESRLERPLLLKLDVQGYEAQVLSGAARLLRQVDWMVLEAAFEERYESEKLFPEILAAVTGYGFRLVRPVAFQVDPKTDAISEVDVLFESMTQEAKSVPCSIAGAPVNR